MSDNNSMSIVMHNFSLLICAYMGVELFGLEISFTIVYVDALYMKEITNVNTYIKHFQMQVTSGSHSMVQYTRITVL